MFGGHSRAARCWDHTPARGWQVKARRGRHVATQQQAPRPRDIMRPGMKNVHAEQYSLPPWLLEGFVRTDGGEAGTTWCHAVEGVWPSKLAHVGSPGALRGHVPPDLLQIMDREARKLAPVIRALREWRPPAAIPFGDRLGDALTHIAFRVFVVRTIEQEMIEAARQDADTEASSVPDRAVEAEVWGAPDDDDIPVPPAMPSRLGDVKEMNELCDELGEWLSDAEFQVREVGPDRLILGDGALVAWDPVYRRMDPYSLDDGVMPGMLCLPLSGRRLLVASSRACSDPAVLGNVTAARINRASAWGSREFFVAAARRPEFEDLRDVIVPLGRSDDDHAGGDNPDGTATAYD